MSVAELGLKIDSGQIAPAVSGLEKLARASGQAEAAVTKLGRGSSRALADGMAGVNANVLRTNELLERLSNQTIYANAQLTKMANGVGSGWRKAADDVERSAKRIKAANSNLSGFNTSNIAAQFQDIGVTSAMGMSPIQIALQQGTQLSAVFNDLRSQGQGVGATLAAAFGSIINPVSLVTLGVVALSAAAIQYFTTWMSGSDESAKSLEEQARLINKVAQEWGNALPALNAYNAEIEKQKSLQDAIAASGIVAAKQYDPARSGLPDLKVAIADIVITLQQAGAESAQIGKVQEEFNQLQAALANSTATSKDALEVQQALSSDLLGVSIPAISDYAAKFGDLASQIAKASAEAARYREEAGMLDMQKSLRPLNPLDGFNRTPFQNEEEIRKFRQDQAARDAENKRLGGLVPTPTARPNLEDQASPGADFIRSQQERIELLKTELGVVGQVDAIRNQAIARLKVEQEIRRMGIDLYGEEAVQMRANAVLELQLTEQTRQAREDAARARREQIAAMDAVRGGFRSFMGDLRQGMANGEGFWESFKSAGLRALDAISDRALDALTNLLFGARGSNDPGLLGNLFQSLMGGGSAPAGGSAHAGGIANVAASALSNYAPGAVTRMPLPPIGATAANSNLGVEAYIRQAAQLRGIDPNIAARVAASEGGLKNPFRQGEAMLSYGREESYGPFQLHMRQGGVGTRALAAGIDPRTNWQGGVDYGLDEAANKGWGQWFGAAKAGIGNREGLEGAHALGKFSTALDKVTTTAIDANQGLGKLGSGLGTMGDALSKFPAAPAAGAGGGGWLSGIGSWIGNMLSPAAWRVVAGGGMTGLFASGGYTGPGGINDPAGIVHRGEVVWSQNDIRKAGGVGVVEAMRRSGTSDYGARGGTAVNVSTVVNNYSNSKVETREEDDGGGGRRIVHTISDQVTTAMNTKGTSLNQAMRSRGAEPARKRR